MTIKHKVITVGRRKPSDEQPAAPAAGAVDPAVVAAVIAMLQSGAVSIPAAAAAAPAVELPQDEADEAEAAETIRRNEERAKTAEALVSDLIPLIMQPRHVEVLEWIAMSRRVSVPQAITQILRAAIASELPNFREWKGGGGGSTKNPDTLARLRNP